MNDWLNLNSPKILVAESDPAILKEVSRLVENAGYRVIKAKDGKEAYGALSHDSDFHVCIIDADLPLIDGLNIVRFMKTQRKLDRIPILMTGAHGSIKAQTESSSFQNLIFLPKPWSSKQVQSMLALLVKKSLKVA